LNRYRLLRKEGAKVNHKTMRILPPNYRVNNPDATIRGKTINELKSTLVKKGYDIHCPQCGNHFGQSMLLDRVACPSCKYVWRVDMQGRPSMTIGG